MRGIEGKVVVLGSRGKHKKCNSNQLNFNDFELHPHITLADPYSQVICNNFSNRHEITAQLAVNR